MAVSSATTVRDLRRSNRSRALWQVFLSGPLTRQEIGVQAGLSPATVSNLVADLVAEGVIIEVGLEDSNGGRPRGLLQVNPEYGYVIGVDVARPPSWSNCSTWVSGSGPGTCRLRTWRYSIRRTRSVTSLAASGR